MRQGFGSYFEAIVEDGVCVEVRLRKRADGSVKVVKPQMLVGYLLEMAAGSASTPKGGHAADLAARAATEVATACGPRSQMRCAARAASKKKARRLQKNCECARRPRRLGGRGGSAAVAVAVPDGRGGG